MELQHFSHEHPLILGEEGNGKESICSGCGKPVSSLPAYICKPCGFFLHRTCAQQLQVINHPVDSQHALTLLKEPPYKSCYCNVCREKWEHFTYHCALCRIDVCMRCVLEERTIEHKSHEHPLSLLKRPAFFFCNACGTEATDSSYVCAKCEFWIHRSCASLPGTTSHYSHDHPLVLCYSLPTSYRRFDYACPICRERIHPPYWIYQCPGCRFVVHVKCATSTKRSIEIEATDAIDPSLISLPVSDASIDLVRIFAMKRLSKKFQNPKKKNHGSHNEHPLFLSESQNNKTDNSVICNCCIGLIPGESYNCSSCSYFLHLYCAALPLKLKNPLQHEHSLVLGSFKKFYNLFKCNACEKACNGFYYGCDKCGFYLDVKCASLPKTITHEAHKHSLSQKRGAKYECDACGISYTDFAMGCETCKYNVCYSCILLPRAARHRWDKHLLPLIYPPLAHHPEEFYCEICEEELHPKDWFYHCRDCDQSFHPRCICLLDEYPNVRFGDKLQVETHPHQLTFLRKRQGRSLCKGCNKNLEGLTVFHCQPCNFHLCRQCILDKDS